MVSLPQGEEREVRNRASFSRWKKRSVFLNHLPSLYLLIKEVRVLPERVDFTKYFT